MIEKVSQRIGQLMQSQDPNNHLQQRPYTGNSNKTPSKSKNSPRLNITDPYINHSTPESKHPRLTPEDLMNPLDRTKSIQISDQKVRRDFETLMYVYKDEIVMMMQPFLTEFENRIMVKIERMDRQIRQLLENQLGKELTLHKQFTFNEGDQRQNNSWQQQEMQPSLFELMTKAEKIESTLLASSRSISTRLNSLQSRVQETQFQKQPNQKSLSNCPCSSLLQQVLATQQSLNQEIKYIKYHLAKSSQAK